MIVRTSRTKLPAHTQGELMTKTQAITLFDRDLRKVASGIAFKFHQNPEELLSTFYEALIKAKNFNVRSKAELTGFAYRCMSNAAVNEYRLSQKMPTDDIDSTFDQEKLGVQPNYELREIAFNIIEGIRKELRSKGDFWLEIFEEVLLGQTKYREAAELFNVPIGTIKTRVHLIRKIAENKFGSQYRLLGFTDNEET